MIIHMNKQRPDAQPDALDNLILNELNEQARWHQTFAAWDARQRQQRRRRLLPVLSNIASVAALVVLGFVLHALVPVQKLVGNTTADQMIPKMEQLVTPTDTAGVGEGTEVAPPHVSP